MSRHILKAFIGGGSVTPDERQRWVQDATDVMRELADLLEIYLQTAHIESGTTYWRQAMAAIAKARWLEEHQ